MTVISSTLKTPVTKQAILIHYKETDLIKITFPFTLQDVANVKTIPERRFIDDGNSKYWICPYKAENIALLVSWNFALDDTLKIMYANFQAKKNTIADTSKLKKIKIPNLKGTLLPFQNIGVSFIESRDGRALIADEQGLGKTIQAIAYLQLHPEHRPAIIVCPASLKLNWQKEIVNWMPHPKCIVVSGGTPYSIGKSEIIIINYDILPKWLSALIALKPKVVIMDEVHKTKSNKALRTKAAKKLAKIAPHVIGLSGTPILNRPIEIFNAGNMIDPGALPNYWTFVKQFCDAKKDRFGWQVNGASNTVELNQLLSTTFMIRRLKKDVLKDLPDKRYCFLPFEITNRKEYTHAEQDFIGYIKETKGKEAAVRASGAEILAQIESLKRLAAEGALASAIEWIEDFLESGEKLVVMAVHKVIIDALMNHFGKIAVKIDGGVANENRQKAVEDFQNKDSIRLFVGNIQAAGVGLTLTAASNLAFLELPWTPGELSQAADRVHRIGQKDAVTIYYLLALNTIMERIAKMLDEKQKVVSAVLDGVSVEKSSLLTELINEYLQ